MLSALSLTLLSSSASLDVGKSSPKNILYVIVDDLRPELGAYGRSTMHTPHFDALAKESVLFDRAYVQLALCAPSRTSFLTGRRPDVTKVFDFSSHFREEGVGDTWWPLPQIMKEAGHLSLGTGKVYHGGSPPHRDEVNSWDEFHEFGNGDCQNPKGADVKDYKPEEVGGQDRWDRAEGDGGFGANIGWCVKTPTYDMNVTQQAIEYMRQAQDAKQPFFVAAGLHKPHLPFQAPQEFFDLYPDEKVTMPEHKVFPKNAPPIAFRDNGAPDTPSPWIPLPDWKIRELRKAYFAAVSFTDSQIGELVQGVRKLGLENDTAIVIHGDHGWHLGELGQWRKFTVFEAATRVPLLVHVPWMPKAHGTRSSQLVEMVDVLPTICELAGVDLPVNQTYDGVSMVPMLDGSGGTTGKNASFSQYPRSFMGAHKSTVYPTNKSEMWIKNGASNNRSSFFAMGHSMRTDQWRYTEWVRWDPEQDSPDWDAPIVDRELYQHGDDVIGDFDSIELINVAERPQFADTVSELSAALRHFFREVECKETLCSDSVEIIA